MRTIFELKVWHQDERSCFLLLLWDNRSKKLTASLPYPSDLQKSYQLWRQRYHRFYKFSAPQSPGNSGRLNPGSGDLAHDLTEAERELVKGFQRWLGDNDGRTIQQRIQDELAQLTQMNANPAIKPGVDVFLACNSDEIARLPWELLALNADMFPPDRLRIVRTAMDEPEAPLSSKERVRGTKARILAVLGNDPNLPLQEDWKAVRSLRSIAHVEQFTWQPEDSVTTIKQTFANTICDSRGWDVLFFAGHSDETAATGGRIAITPNVSLSISEIEEYLTQARENGLQLAIFNSCSGLSIANSLVALGLQVVVMREPIRNDVAQSFLKPLCQQLVKHIDIHSAIVKASYYLQSAEKFTYPSAHLLPAFFSLPHAVPYQFKPVGWKQQLRRCIPTRQWLPSVGEAITVGTILTFSLMPGVQTQLFELRTLVQASYRHLTNQFSLNTKQPPPKPPVLLIAIDQASLDQPLPGASESAIETISAWPIDRRYLAQLITKLSDAGAQVVGIDYFIDTQQPGEQQLSQALQAAIKKQNAWFILAASQKDNFLVRDHVASPNWSLEGDILFYKWDVKLPQGMGCIYCPFGYLLALAATLNQYSDAPQPNVNSQADLQLEVSRYIRRQQRLESTYAGSLLTNAFPPLGLRSIIDFSLPPAQVYTKISAQDFLNTSASSQSLQFPLEYPVVIIATGDYVDAEDHFNLPPAISYWCHYSDQFSAESNICPQVLTGGEVHAYMVYQLLSSHRVIQIPDWWMVCFATLLGKGFITIFFRERAVTHRKKQIGILLGGTAAYGLLGLQAYISAAVVIPWFFPSLLFWVYIIKALKQKSMPFS